MLVTNIILVNDFLMVEVFTEFKIFQNVIFNEFFILVYDTHKCIICVGFLQIKSNFIICINDNLMYLDSFDFVNNA